MPRVRVKGRRADAKPCPSLAKTPTGITGLDEITGGGLPTGRPTLVCGSAGCGKTVLAMEFLLRGAIEYDEPGVFMAFEETAEELRENVRSLGFDLDALIAKRRLVVDHVRIDRSEIEETGEYDLEALFVRLAHAVKSTGARRVVLDTIESLFSGLTNAAIVRSELRRLFRWLKDQGLTAIITGERGEGQLTRSGLEEYVSDCVLLLDHRIEEQLSTRRLRIVKYRGSSHGTNEYPFLIDEDGMSVLPITSLGLDHEVSSERISTGISSLDAMLGGRGVFRGSTVLVSGTAGTGKTSVASHFAAACCGRGERCLIFSFEESPAQLVRNMRSLALDLEPWRQEGLLEIEAARPTTFGLERHLTIIHKRVAKFRPHLVIVEPITTFLAVGSASASGAMITRVVDFLKAHGITTLLTSLTPLVQDVDPNEIGISSIVDTWIALRDVEDEGIRTRALCVVKSRGMAHSDELRELVLADRGISLRDPIRGLKRARAAAIAREAALTAARRRVNGKGARP